MVDSVGFFASWCVRISFPLNSRTYAACVNRGLSNWQPAKAFPEPFCHPCRCPLLAATPEMPVTPYAATA